MEAPHDLSVPQQTTGLGPTAVAANLAARPVPLTIRSPSLPSDHSLSVDPAIRIGDLKRRLEAELPLKPKAEDIRVIFAGRLVGDGESVEGMLGGRISHTETAADVPQPVLHVVFRHGATLVKLQPGPEGGRLSPAPAQESSASAPLAGPIAASSASELRQRNVAGVSNSLGQFGGAAAPSLAVPQVTTPSVAPQFAYYYQPMMVNGMPYYVPVPNPALYGASSTHLPTSSFGTATFAEPPAQPAPAPAPPPQQQPALPPPEPDPLDGGAEENENPFSLLLRLAFMVYLFSQNAPFSRVVAMHVLAIFVFLWRTGRLRGLRGAWIRRGGAGRGIVPPQPERAPQQQQPLGPDGQPLPPVLGANGQPVPPQPHVPQRNLLQNAGNIAYTFVASLIPQGVEAN